MIAECGPVKIPVGLTKNNLKPSEVFAVANQSGFDTYTSLTGETKNVDEIIYKWVLKKKKQLRMSSYDCLNLMER